MCPFRISIPSIRTRAGATTSCIILGVCVIIPVLLAGCRFIKGKELEALVNMQLGRKATADEVGNNLWFIYFRNETGLFVRFEW